MATNTTKQVAAGKKVSDKELQSQVEAAAGKLGKDPLVEVAIPKALKPKIGETLPLGVNGAFIVLPVDGTKHKVPKTFADLLQDYLSNLTM